MREIVYSTKPATLQQLILSMRMVGQDWIAALELIVQRTDLTPLEALELDEFEVHEVLVKIMDGVNRSRVLVQMSKSMEP